MPETTKPVPTRRCAKHWLDADGKRISEKAVPAHVRHILGRKPRVRLPRCPKCGRASIRQMIQTCVSRCDCWYCGVWLYNPFANNAEWRLTAEQREWEIENMDKSVAWHLSKAGRAFHQMQNMPLTDAERRGRRNMARRIQRQQAKAARQMAADAGLTVL